jgi:cytoskeleton protein RodZ
MDESDVPDPALFPETVAERLRAARVKKGVDLSDIATRTRIPLRHLTAIEAGNYDALPTHTYCVGFVKSYARAIGEDEVALARDLREELGMTSTSTSAHVDYDAGDPARVPPRMLAWTALGVAVLIGLVYGLWRTGTFGGEGDVVAIDDPIIDQNIIATNGVVGNATAAVAAPPSGAVVLTAMDAVWVQVDDDKERAIIARELKAGETFVVPATSVNPRLKTGRPNAIKVTVGGVVVPTLGPPETLIRNVPISATALTSRAAPPPAPSASANTPRL